MSTPETQQAGLVEQLKAALDADERIARATMLSESDDGDWIVCHDDNGEPTGVLGTCIHIAMIGGNGDLDDPAQAEHIARRNPKNTLAMVAAHREILELHTAAGRQPASSGGWYYCTTCGSGEAYEYPAEWPCQTLILLAQGYGMEVQ